MIDVLVKNILVGKVASLGPRAVPSGMAKLPVAGLVSFDEMGMKGDAQADLKAHGGVEKAIHHYPFDHYDNWQDYLDGEVSDYKGPDLSQAGAFGENISTVGIREADVFLGDIFQLGTGVVQVSQGRQPCWKLNERFGIKTMARMVQKSGRTGWYYRVLEPGEVKAGDGLVLKERLADEWSLSRITELLYDKTDDFIALEKIVKLPFLADSWRSMMERRLSRGKIEDWSSRLDGKKE